MAQIFTVTNQKGGTGKTTTAAALSAGLQLKGFTTLLIDLDAQGNLSYATGADRTGLTIADLLQQILTGGTPRTAEAIKPTEQGDIITAAASLAGADTILAETLGKEYKVKEILEPIKGRYDYIVIDTPPTLGTLTINALTAADKVIAPAQAEVFSLTALDQLQSTIATVRRYTNPNIELSGILLTRYNPRAVLSREIAQRLEQTAAQYGTKLYKATIRECTALKEAEITQQSIFKYAPKSNAAKDYTALINEILERG